MAVDLSPSQRRNGLGIIRAVKARGWPKKAAVIAIETALVESGMRMIASANVPESQKYPHEKLDWTDDGLGHDHASCGMFQQQTGTAWTPAGYGRAMNQTTMDSPNGWGTPAELMNAEKSTAKFLDALARIDWPGMEPWHAAQAVQGSAFPDGSNYRGQHDRAVRIVNELWTVVALEDAVVELAKGRDMKLLVVDQAECKRKKQAWPGYFADFGYGQPLVHIKSGADLRALRVSGWPAPKKISLWTYKQRGGK